MGYFEEIASFPYYSNNGEENLHTPYKGKGKSQALGAMDMEDISQSLYVWIAWHYLIFASLNDIPRLHYIEEIEKKMS